MRRNLAVGVVLIAALAVSSGCSSSHSSSASGPPALGGGATASGSGGSGGSAAGGAKPDLCAAVSSTQIEAAIGRPVDPGKPATAPGVGCGWIATKTGDDSTAGVLYAQMASYDAAKKLAGQNNETMTAVPGLGDEAYAQTFGPTGAPLLFVKKGSNLVTISADLRIAPGNDHAPQATDLAAEKQIAAIVVGVM